MKSNERFPTTVIASDPHTRVRVLARHRLTLDRPLDFTEGHFHVTQAAIAERTLVRGLHVLVVAAVVYAMAARHEHHGLR